MRTIKPRLTHTHKHRLPGAGDHTMSHQREEILCSRWVMKLWRRLSWEAERLTVKSPGNQWPVQFSPSSDWGGWKWGTRRLSALANQTNSEEGGQNQHCHYQKLPVLINNDTKAKIIKLFPSYIIKWCIIIMECVSKILFPYFIVFIYNQMLCMTPTLEKRVMCKMRSQIILPFGEFLREYGIYFKFAIE